MTAHLTVFQRNLARRLRAGGMSLRGIAKEVGCSHSGIEVVLRGGQAREARADEMRRASRQLSPNLANVVLETALRELADSYRPGLTVTISISPDAASRLHGRSVVTRATGMYRICEQALLNSAIHGHASEYSIRVVLDERDAYLLEIRDNGVGLSGAPIVPGMGSTVISAWVDSLQGVWSLEPAGAGMMLTATIPAA